MADEKTNLIQGQQPPTPTSRTNELGPPSPERRRFLTAITVGLSGLAGAVVGIPVVGLILGPLLRRKPEQWLAVGEVERFEVGKTVAVTFRDTSSVEWAGLAALTSAYLRREGPEQFTAFSVNCTHLGCPIRWMQEANLFLCPCHGGVFYSDGRVAGGPPTRPLFRYETRIRNGVVELQDRKLPPFSDDPGIG